MWIVDQDQSQMEDENQYHLVDRVGVQSVSLSPWERKETAVREKEVTLKLVTTVM